MTLRKIYSEMNRRIFNLAKPYRIKELESRLGNLHEVIPQLVNLHGQAEAARLLGLSQTTVSQWLKVNGYRQKIEYVREEQTA